MKEQQEERQNTNNIMETKFLAQTRNLAASEAKYKKLEGQYNVLVQFQEGLRRSWMKRKHGYRKCAMCATPNKGYSLPSPCLLLASYVFPFLAALIASDKNDSDHISGLSLSVESTTRHGNT